MCTKSNRVAHVQVPQAMDKEIQIAPTVLSLIHNLRVSSAVKEGLNSQIKLGFLL